MGLAADPISTQRQLTEFVDDGNPVKPSITSTVTQVTDAMCTTKTEDITLSAVLGWPHEIETVAWTQSLTNGNLIMRHSTIGLITNSPNNRKKLANFTYLRTDVVVKLVINATPQMTGRLWMYYEPFRTSRDANRRSRTYLANQTGYPGVEIDVGNATSAEIRIPYWSPREYIDMTDSNQDFGNFATVSVTVLAPLRSVIGTDEVTVTMFSWLENTCLSGPTQNETIMGVPQSTREEEKHDAQQGKISSVARQVSTVSTALGKIPIPGVSEIANTVSWASDAVANTAASMGYLKPDTGAAAMPFVQLPASGFTNSDGPIHTVKLAGFASNELAPDVKGFPDMLDPMSTRYVSSRACFIDSFDWSTTDTAGTVLKVIPVTPTYSCEESVVGIKCLSTLGYLSSFAAYWGGSLAYRLSFVKNPFYSGRVGVAFVPLKYPPFDFTNFAFASTFREVIDVRQSSEFETTVPFLSDTPWKQISLSDGLTPFPYTSDTATGSLVVYVINELRAPSSIPSTMRVNVHQKGGDDFELGVWKCTSFNISGFGQSFDTATNSSYDLTTPPPMFKVAPRTVATSAYTTGESLKSLRAFVRRAGEHNQIASRNFSIDLASFGGSSSGGANCMPVNACSYLYAGYRGSMRLHIVPISLPNFLPANGASQSWFRVALINPTSIDSGDYITNPSTNNIDAADFQHIISPDRTGIASVTMPYYGNTATRITTNSGRQARVLSPLVQVALYDSTFDTGDGVFRLFVSAGDDFTFGYLVGAPPLAVT